jgi:UDP-N-acetylenolpyruvoylglucosamine reductase
MTENNASYRDLLTLIKEVKENVKNKYDIELINEVRIITN